MTVTMKLQRWLQDCPTAYQNFFLDVQESWDSDPQSPPIMEMVNAELVRYRAKMIISPDKTKIGIEFEDERDYTWFLLKWA